MRKVLAGKIASRFLAVLLAPSRTCPRCYIILFICTIADDRTFGIGQMHPDLIAPTRLGCQFD